MKPHAMRRLLWFGNFGLVAGVAAAGWHLVSDVTPATASVLARKSDHISKEYKGVISKYDKDRSKQSSWKAKPPVTNAEVRAVFLEKWSKPKREKPHFPFVGPLPPPIAQVVEEVIVKKKLPTGLVTVGEPSMLVYAPPSHVMLFEFKSGKSEAFAVGDWIREEDDTTERFKMLGLEAIDFHNYAVVYGVYEDGKEVKRDKLGFTNPPDEGDTPEVIRDLAKKTPAGAVGTLAAGTPGGNAGDPKTSGTTEAGEVETDPAKTPLKPFKESDIVTVGGGPVSLGDARPEVRKYGPNQRAVLFTAKTRKYFQGKNAAKLAESIKTSVATSGGRTIGLRVTGFGKDLSGDTFDVKKGDILVSVNGVPVRDRAGVVELVKRLPENQLVTLVVNRHGKLITYKVDPSDPRNRRNVRYFENVKDFER